MLDVMETRGSTKYTYAILHHFGIKTHTHIQYTPSQRTSCDIVKWMGVYSFIIICFIEKRRLLGSLFRCHFPLSVKDFKREGIHTYTNKHTQPCSFFYKIVLSTCVFVCAMEFGSLRWSSWSGLPFFNGKATQVLVNE